jgi:hypothetical protein
LTLPSPIHVVEGKLADFFESGDISVFLEHRPVFREHLRTVGADRPHIDQQCQLHHVLVGPATGLGAFPQIPSLAILREQTDTGFAISVTNFSVRSQLFDAAALILESTAKRSSHRKTIGLSEADASLFVQQSQC